MSMILTDGGGGRRKKRVWRSDYVTEQFNDASSP
jgi:hypothetical protein